MKKSSLLIWLAVFAIGLAFFILALILDGDQSLLTTFSGMWMGSAVGNLGWNYNQRRQQRKRKRLLADKLEQLSDAALTALRTVLDNEGAFFADMPLRKRPRDLEQALTELTAAGLLEHVLPHLDPESFYYLPFSWKRSELETALPAEESRREAVLEAPTAKPGPRARASDLSS